MASYKSETLHILSERGFVNQHTDIDGLDNALKSGMVTAYCGYDPTADSLHVGHLITLMMLHWLQQTGHRPITLMGGGTGLVGDPSFKSEARPMMTEDKIEANIAGLKTACGPILRYGNTGNDAIMVNNATWLKKIGYLEFLREYGPHFSVNKMLSFDSVKLRLDREQHLSFLEFNYSLLQAYDFVELYKNYNCSLQVAGADQWGNIVSGTELGCSDNLPKFALSAGDENAFIIDILVRSGLAESKGEARRLIKGNGIKLNDTPVIDENAKLSDGDFDNDSTLKLSAGKKRHILVVKA